MPKGADYDVGWGKTPLATRFSPTNQPKNRGRRKGAKGMKAELRKVLGREISLTVNGKPTRALPLPFVLTRLAREAVAGKLSSGRDLIDLVMRVFGTEDFAEARSTLSSDDAALLAEWVREQLAAEGAMEQQEPQAGLTAPELRQDGSRDPDEPGHD